MAAAAAMVQLVTKDKVVLVTTMEVAMIPKREGTTITTIAVKEAVRSLFMAVVVEAVELVILEWVVFEDQ